MDKKSIKEIYQVCINLAKQADAEAKASENGQPSQAVIEALKNTFQDIINFEKTYLITAYDAFAGCMLMNMEIGIDFTQRGFIDLKMDTEPVTVSYNPIFCDYNFLEFTGKTVQEILRLTYGDPATFAQLNSEKDPKKHASLEVGSDVATSSIVQRDIRLGQRDSGLRLPKDSYTVSKLNQELKVNAADQQSMEYYYNIDQKFRRRNHGDGDGDIPAPFGGQGDGMPSGGVATPSNGQGNQVHDWEGNNVDETKDRIKSMVSEAYNNMSEKQRGMMPSRLVEHIKKLLAPPKINWKQVLRKMVGSVPVPYRKTKTRLNRRQPERADLSGRLPKRTVNIICAFDTSGSMSDRDIAYCMNEVFNIVKVYEGVEITIVECDARIGKIYKAKNMAQVQTKVTGRGGTAFTPVIEFINGEGEFKNHPQAGKFRDALMVYFTDGYGEWEIPKPKTYRNLWVIVGPNATESCLSLKEPYGDVRVLKEDDDWQKMRNNSY
jgi:predicted metal-dependent peptidase